MNLSEARKWAVCAAVAGLAGCGESEPEQTPATRAEQRIRAEVREVDRATLTAVRCAKGLCAARVRYGKPVTEAEKDRHAECFQTAEDPMLDCEVPDEPVFQRLIVRYDRAGRLIDWTGLVE